MGINNYTKNYCKVLSCVSETHLLVGSTTGLVRKTRCKSSVVLLVYIHYNIIFCVAISCYLHMQQRFQVRKWLVYILNELSCSSLNIAKCDCFTIQFPILEQNATTK